jgi:hypothetical protein
MSILTLYIGMCKYFSILCSSTPKDISNVIILRFSTSCAGKVSSRMTEFIVLRVQHILKLSASLAVQNVRIHDFGLIDTHNRTNRCVFARHSLTVLVNSSWLSTVETSKNSLRSSGVSRLIYGSYMSLRKNLYMFFYYWRHTYRLQPAISFP